MTQIIEMSEGRMGLFLYKISSFCWLRVSGQNKKVRIWHMVTLQKKAIAVGVAGLLTLGSTNLHAAEGASGGAEAAGAGSAAGGISVAAAVSLGVVGLGLIAVAVDDNDSTTPERPPFTPPVTPTTTATTTTTGTTNTTTTTTTTTTGT